MEPKGEVRGTKRTHSGNQTRLSDNGTATNQKHPPASHHTALESDPSHPEDFTATRLSPTTKPTVEAKLSMHPEKYFKDLYSTEPDFYQLGVAHPEFGAVLKNGSQLDFADPNSVMQLTKTLLKADFNLQLNLPSDRLCPPVPNRHNYILWLKDLLDSSSSSYTECFDPERRVVGLDIGTGASLIYPLLGCAQRSSWHFVATDIDATSLEYARINARLNELEHRIRIVPRQASEPLIPLDELGLSNIDFVMVNPPFYSSENELASLAAQKSKPPNTACTGAPNEMVCDGGEVGFIQRILQESLLTRRRVQWYTAMVGKQSSLEVLVDRLKEHKIHNYAITTFIQGTKTRRWAIAWSFVNRRPWMSSSRGYNMPNAKRLLPPATEIVIHEHSSGRALHPVVQIEDVLDSTIQALDMTYWSWTEHDHRGIGFSNGDVWSRAYRRKKAREDPTAAQQANTTNLADSVPCAFGFSIRVVPKAALGQHPTVVVRWLQGDDHVLFESFAGVVRRRLRENKASLE
ncbi:hypothetical protein GGR57DRAFT_180274 [Xylariaceae sp. FL1272]|nr:hypothetical protein GGR57DRAFT_180274 [Xylariaceae sp. FL1272]